MAGDKVRLITGRYNDTAHFGGMCWPLPRLDLISELEEQNTVAKQVKPGTTG